MTQRLRINVTQPLIERATARDSRHCMIAEAMTTAYPHLRNVIVDLATIRWSNPKTGKRYVALTPEIAASRLVDFDQGNPVEPFTFSAAPIQVTDRYRAIETRAEAKAAGRTTPRTKPPSTTKKVRGAEAGHTLVEGGRPIPAGHLSNRPPSGAAGKAAATKAAKAKAAAKAAKGTATVAAVPEAASNVARSSRRYRQYGRRLLQG